MSETEPRLIRRRLRYERGFVQLPNGWLRDNKLSFKARGLLAMLMTHEDGWKVTLKAIAADNPEGIDSLRSAVQELEEANYLKRHPINIGGRFHGDHWEIQDPADDGTIPLFTALENPTRKATALDNPMRTALENPTPIRTPVEEINSSRGNHKRPCGHEPIPNDDRGYCVMGCPVQVSA